MAQSCTGVKAMINITSQLLMDLKTRLVAQKINLVYWTTQPVSNWKGYGTLGKSIFYNTSISDWEALLIQLLYWILINLSWHTKSVVIKIQFMNKISLAITAFISNYQIYFNLCKLKFLFDALQTLKPEWKQLSSFHRLKS